MQSIRPIRSALISLSNKTHLIDFAKELQKLGVVIYSTGGTAKALSDAGIAITLVAELTDFPEIMEGRVKTLHPKIHGGILGKRDEHQSDAHAHGIAWIDLVVVNLYPFEETVQMGAPFSKTLENIDIGGPAMLRAAAKNHAWVTVVHDPEDYSKVLLEMEQGGVSAETRRYLATKAFAHTAYYDALIASYLQGNTPLMEQAEITLPLKRLAVLRYGENPHQAAGLFHPPFGYGLAQAEVLQGKALSYNNLMDAEAAFHCAREFEDPTVVVVKHSNPCGVASDEDLDAAYQKAIAADSQSAFGGVVALNRSCTAGIAKHLASIFMEVIVAPSFTKEARALLEKKPNLRVIAIPGWEHANTPYLFRAISGGLLIQNNDQHVLKADDLECVTKLKPSPDEIKELLFAWKLVKHLKSNAIAISKNHVSIGLSGGQVSRIAALKFALSRAEKNTEGAVLASDAFFPFRDSVDALEGCLIRAIIQPGGSLRDSEIIAACDEYGIAMVFTHIRCFNH